MEERVKTTSKRPLSPASENEEGLARVRHGEQRDHLPAARSSERPRKRTSNLPESLESTRVVEPQISGSHQRLLEEKDRTIAELRTANLQQARQLAEEKRARYDQSILLREKDETIDDLRSRLGALTNTRNDAQSVRAKSKGKGNSGE